MPEENFSSLDSIDIDSKVDTEFSSTKVTSDDSSDLETVNINKTVPDYNFPTLRIQLLKQQTDSFIRKFRTTVAGGLAISLWVALIATGWWHTHMIGTVAVETLNKATLDKGNEEELDFEAYDKASSIVGDAAKTLYAVISPLATAITGFYFVIQNERSDDNEDS